MEEEVGGSEYACPPPLFNLLDSPSVSILTPDS